MSLVDFDIHSPNGQFKDILPKPQKDYQELYNELDRDAGEVYDEDIPF